MSKIKPKSANLYSPLIRDNDIRFERLIIAGYENKGTIPLWFIDNNEEEEDYLDLCLSSPTYDNQPIREEDGYYAINMFNEKVVKIVAAYYDVKDNWPDPFLPGYPLEYHKEGFHALIGPYGEAIVYKWFPIAKEYSNLKNSVRYNPYSMNVRGAKYLGKVTVNV